MKNNIDKIFLHNKNRIINSSSRFTHKKTYKDYKEGRATFEEVFLRKEGKND
jgi:hypothetical protein